MTTEVPRVSVVLPVYNGGDYLRRSIDSVLRQSMTDWELIVWDDGSTDGSADVIAGYSDIRVRAFSHSRNQGLFETINAAIRAARAPLIRLWSQDDIMKDDCLTEHVAFHAAHPEVAMSYCLVDVIDGDGAVINAAVPDGTPEVILPAVASQIMYRHGSLTGNISTVMLTRRVIEDLGAFREDMRVAADFEMWVRIAGRHTIGCVYKSLILLRRHVGQFSRRPGVNVLFMRERRELFSELRGRLPAGAQSWAWQYDRRRHLQLDTHYMLRCLLGGHLRLAVDAYREIAKETSVFLSVALLILTADGHLFRPSPRYFPS